MSREPKYPKKEYDGFKIDGDDDYGHILEAHTSKLVKCRKDHQCACCGSPIKKGDWAVYEKVFLDGYPSGIHDCLDCVEDFMRGWGDEAQARWKKSVEENHFMPGFEPIPIHKQSEQNQQREYEIFQLNRANCVFAFCNYSYLQKQNAALDVSCYDSVYKGTMEPGMDLESIYAMFNINRPEDFKGHSLSVSDVIVVRENDSQTAYFVDSIGFKVLPGFFDAPIKSKETPKSQIQDAPKRSEPYK